MNNKNLNFLNKLIDNNKKKEKNIYQLSPNSFSNKDIIENIKVLLSNKITERQLKLLKNKLLKIDEI
jgi:hypothetical protein